jgi:hypothetical protein
MEATKQVRFQGEASGFSFHLSSTLPLLQLVNRIVLIWLWSCEIQTFFDMMVMNFCDCDLNLEVASQCISDMIFFNLHDNVVSLKIFFLGWTSFWHIRMWLIFVCEVFEYMSFSLSFFLSGCSYTWKKIFYRRKQLLLCTYNNPIPKQLISEVYKLKHIMFLNLCFFFGEFMFL